MVGFSKMSSGSAILGKTLLDVLNTNVSSNVATFGSTFPNAKVLLYDSNAPISNGYVVAASNSRFTINAANGASPLIGLGTTNPAVALSVNSTDAIRIPVGLTAERPAGESGYIRYNTSLNAYEGFSSGNWTSLGGVKSVDQQTYIGAANDGYLRFYNSNVQDVVINSLGNVGIGSLTPTCKLDVTGGDAVIGTLTCSNLSVLGSVSGILPGSYANVTLYQPSGDGSKTVTGNDATAANCILYSFSLAPGQYMVTSTIGYSNLTNIVATPSSAWASVGLYAATPGSYTTSTTATNFVTIGVDATVETMSRQFSFFVDTPTAANYVVALRGAGYQLRVASGATLQAINVRGMGTNDTYAVRTALQTAPVRYTHALASATTTIPIVTAGNFTAASSNADVFINGMKLGYGSAASNDFTLATTYDSIGNQSTFTLTLNNQANIGDVVDAIVWPVVPTSSAYSSGYLYQKFDIVGPWQNTTGVAYSSSNIGIGTVAPTVPLHVVGNALVTGSLTTSNLNVLGANTVIQGVETVTSNVTIDNVAGFGPALKVTQTGVGANYPIADFYDNDVSTTVPALRIADGGNVGIGTGVPAAKLHVVGSIVGSGSVGIGTLAPLAALHVNGDANINGTSVTATAIEIGQSRLANGTSYVDFHSSTGTDYDARLIKNSGSNSILSMTNVGDIAIASGSTFATTTERVRVTSTGSVGIGTIAPRAGLDVVGSTIISGSVGIGKSTIGNGYSLDVSGSVNASSIVVGGSTAKQIDCGYSSYSGGATSITINFNFTFINAPKVVATNFYANETTQVWAFFVESITTTGFTANYTYVNGGSSAVQSTYIFPFNWIAIG